MSEDIDLLLKKAIFDCENLKDSQKTNIRGKHYAMVHTRVQLFRKYLASLGKIETTVLEQTEQKVTVEAEISVWRDGNWCQIANDFAEEYRGEGPVNKTSALENCCTSAIGRALSACGLTGGEYASAFEVENAINNKGSAPKAKKPQAKNPSSKYQIRISASGDVLQEMAPNQFVAYCSNHIADPKNAAHVEYYAGTRQELKRVLNDSYLKEINRTAVYTIMDKFEGGNNATA